MAPADDAHGILADLIGDLSGPDEDLTLGEFLQSEVSWRLIEWRDTREQRQPAAAPRLLRAS